MRKRWVVKAGSNLICSGGPLLIRAWMQQVAELRKKHGIEVIWVTSGAIASAVDRTSFRRRTKDLPKRDIIEKQALSAIGQPMVMDLYNLALQSQGLMGAQILLSYDDLANPTRKACFQKTIAQLLKWKVTPVLNENDAVANEEIKFGDNDSLSAKVSHCTSADRLVILTDVEGLYDADPAKVRDAQLIRRLKGVPESVLAKVHSGSGSQRGTGGMYSKLKAAAEATERGIPTWLVRGDIPSVLLSLARDELVGTKIDAVRSRRRVAGKVAGKVAGRVI